MSGSNPLSGPSDHESALPVFQSESLAGEAAMFIKSRLGDDPVIRQINHIIWQMIDLGGSRAFDLDRLETVAKAGHCSLNPILSLLSILSSPPLALLRLTFQSVEQA